MSSYFDAVRNSAGNSYVWETEVPLILNQTFDPGFHIDLHCKDWNLGYEMGRKFGVPLQAFGLMEQTYYKVGHVYVNIFVRYANALYREKNTQDKVLPFA